MDDHYFGQIPSRVQAFMKDLEIMGHRLGIPMKTRHNEVAPNQFEFAPIFGETNLAVDQNMLIMGVMKRVARKHGFRVLLHEKPFEGINGSGKHNNWSLSTNTGVILYAPGKDPMSNLQFVTFFVNTLEALRRHGALLKASIASATNAHRLGANEAPPAIISAFLGKTMTDVLHKLLTVPDDTDIVIAGKHAYDLGLVEIPEIFIDNTDRNRTSPFAFTGNRFEFRAVGSKANCSSAMTTLNTMVAEQLTDFKADVDKEMAAGADVKVAVMRTLKPIIARIIDTVCFDGNGYADTWPKEAQKRGLDIERCVPKMFLENVKPDAVAMFEKMGVFTQSELHARNEVKFETYVKLVQIEARVLGDLAINHIIPAAIAYQSTLLKNVAMMKSLFPTEWENLSSSEVSIIKKIAGYNADIKAKVDAMVEKRKVANRIDDMYEKAMAYYEIAESFSAIRRPIDKLEEIVDDSMWPMPKYRELLWIR
jgi:glutamine synthetase